MIREKLNQNWQFAKGSPSMMDAFMGGPQFEDVNLPHDAMVHEERTPDTANGTQTGYWPGGLYTYVKSLMFLRNGRIRRLFWNLKVSMRRPWCI